MRWDWDFIRGRKRDFPKHLHAGLRTDVKMVSINNVAHPMQGPHLSDMEVAGQVRMLDRRQLNHESICTLARDRIVYLADRLGEIEAITADDIGRAIYEVSNRYIAPNFPPDHKLRSYDELSDIEKRLHADYGGAVLALITGARPHLYLQPSDRQLRHSRARPGRSRRQRSLT